MAFNIHISPQRYYNIFFIIIVCSILSVFYIYLNVTHSIFLRTSDVLLKTSVKLVFLNSGIMNNQISTQLKLSDYPIIQQDVSNDDVVKTFYESRKTWNTSKLGAILFKNEPYPVLSRRQANKTFLILVYKQWKFLQRRHVYNFGSTRKDPLESCSVRNCIFSGNDSDLTTADAVIVHLFTSGMIPETRGRRSHQRWIFLDDEAPRDTILTAKRKRKLSEMHHLFNWSMTYRTIADIPVPYGRTVPLKASKLDKNLTDIIPNWAIKRRDVLAAILISNCGVPYRKTTLKLMQRYLENRLHVHGSCGNSEELKKSCPGHFRTDCELMSKYLFYLVLENSKCKEYITEKLFYHAYSRGSIPVIQGPSIKDCAELLPPNSYLHFDNFTTIEDLVKEMDRISMSNDSLLYYHQWRYHFDIRNEHGYFGSKSYHLCRVCEAMNYNGNNTSVYSEDDLKRYLDKKSLCRL